MQNFFYGWYLKCQSDTGTIAMIPAVHQCGQRCTCSIQMITDETTYDTTFPAWTFCRKSQNGNILKPIGKVQEQAIVIGESIFCHRGVKLSIHTPELQAEGKLLFHELTPLKFDIMGPFVWVPFMECRHSVYSMQHLVNGTILVNGQKYVFQNAVGYWEGDRGYSFPKEYLWTQCNFDGGSLMLSVADIPMFGKHFTGVIGVVLWQGEEYRFATYLGARIRCLQNGIVRLVQGDMELEARLLNWEGTIAKKARENKRELEKKGLRAPVQGAMNRVIHENVSYPASYRFRKGDEVYLNFESDKASFEYEYHK